MKGLSIGNQKGIGVIEVLVSIMVIVSAVTAVIMVVFGNQGIESDNELNNIALYRASEILESARIAGMTDFASVVNATSSFDVFDGELTVSDISPCRKDITGSVDWSVQLSRPQNIFLTTSLVSAEESAALGGDCFLTPPAETWEIDCPPQYGFDLNPAGLAASAIDLIPVGSDKIVVMTSNKGSIEKEDLWIIDVTDRTAVTLLSSLNTGPDANDVDAFEDYAYVANNDTTGQLIVVDISDLSAPATVSYTSLPGVDPSGSYPQAREIFYHGGKVYVGTRETAGPEFHIFDVSNPASPVHLGSREINHTINSIVVRGDYAYLATTGDQNELVILNISNPSSITPSFPGVGNPELWRFNAPGTQDGRVLYVLGNRLYLGRERGTGTSYDFMVLDISDPAAVTQLGGALMGLNPNTSIEGIVVSAGFSFISTSDSTTGFRVWNTSVPQSMTEIDSCNYSEKAVDLDFDGEFIYVANESNNALRIINDATP